MDIGWITRISVPVAIVNHWGDELHVPTLKLCRTGGSLEGALD